MCCAQQPSSWLPAADQCCALNPLRAKNGATLLQAVARVPGPQGPHPCHLGAFFMARPDPLLCARLAPGGGLFAHSASGAWPAAAVPCVPRPRRRGGPAPYAPPGSPPASCARPLVRRVSRLRGRSLGPSVRPLPSLLCGLPWGSPLFRLRRGPWSARALAGSPPPLVRRGAPAPGALSAASRAFFRWAPGLFLRASASRRLLPPAGVPPAGVVLGPLRWWPWVSPLPPPRPCRPLRGLAGSARLRLGPSGPFFFPAVDISKRMCYILFARLRRSCWGPLVTERPGCSENVRPKGWAFSFCLFPSAALLSQIRSDCRQPGTRGPPSVFAAGVQSRNCKLDTFLPL